MNAAASQHQYRAGRDSSNEETETTMDRSDAAEGASDRPDRSLRMLLRAQAARLIDWTLHAELQLLLARHASIADENGYPAYVRNGYQPPRELITNLGPVGIRIPKVRSRVDPRVVFRSALARPYLRRTRAAIDRAPARFLRALSSGDMHQAIAVLMGPEAAALPPPVIRRLTERWEREHKQWLTGSLLQLRGASLWLDSIEGDEDPAHAIGAVMLAVGIDASACEQILAVVHGARATRQSWMHLLLGLRSRGMPAPVRVHAKGRASAAIAAAAATVYPQAQLADAAPAIHTPNMTRCG